MSGRLGLGRVFASRVLMFVVATFRCALFGGIVLENLCFQHALRAIIN